MERKNMGMDDINANIKPVYPSPLSPPPSTQSSPSRSSSKFYHPKNDNQ